MDNGIVEEAYIINEYTMAILPYYTSDGDLCSIVLDKYRVMRVAKSPKKIVKDSCIFYGSDMNGRMISASAILPSKKMVPIMISVAHKLCMVPLSSPHATKCIWIAYQHVIDIFPSKDQSIILFTNYKKAKVEVTRKTLDTKLDIAARLVSTYDIRIERMGEQYNHHMIVEEAETYSIDPERFKG